MEKKKMAVIGWAAAGAFFSLCVLATLIWGLNTSPKFLADPGKVTAAADEVMALAVSGDYAALSEKLYDSPDLGTVPAKENTAQSMIWYAYMDSLEYTLTDRFEAADSTASVGVNIRCLDISAVMDALQESAPGLMAAKAQETDEESDIYDADHNYLPAFVAEVLREATADILKKQPQTMEREITLQLVRNGGAWQVVPTEDLIRLLSGGLAR